MVSQTMKLRIIVRGYARLVCERNTENYYRNETALFFILLSNTIIALVRELWLRNLSYLAENFIVFKNF